MVEPDNNKANVTVRPWFLTSEPHQASHKHFGYPGEKTPSYSMDQAWSPRPLDKPFEPSQHIYVNVFATETEMYKAANMGVNRKNTVFGM